MLHFLSKYLSNERRERIGTLKYEVSSNERRERIGTLKYIFFFVHTIRLRAGLSVKKDSHVGRLFYIVFDQTDGCLCDNCICA